MERTVLGRYSCTLIGTVSRFEHRLPGHWRMGGPPVGGLSYIPYHGIPYIIFDFVCVYGFNTIISKLPFRERRDFVPPFNDNKAYGCIEYRVYMMITMNLIHVVVPRGTGLC